MCSRFVLFYLQIFIQVIVQPDLSETQLRPGTLLLLPYLKADMCLRIVLIMASAWPLDESLSRPMTSVMPLRGRPFSALVASTYRTPAQAPRLPSQFSGLGSSLGKWGNAKDYLVTVGRYGKDLYFSSISKALADTQNSSHL